jgi:hypothetical protein
VTRRAIATLLFCAAILAALGAAALHSFDSGDHRPVATARAERSSCAPVDEDGAWDQPHRVLASVTEWAARCRTAHAHALPGTSLPRPVSSAADTTEPPARTPFAPSYLLHTPLLI